MCIRWNPISVHNVVIIALNILVIMFCFDLNSPEDLSIKRNYN